MAESSNVNDIPTTIIRSKQDIAAGAASAASLSNSTNDIVINKLTQILSYLRAGKIFYVFCFTTLPRNELFCFKHISLFFPKGNRNKKKKKDKYAGVYDSNMDKMINNSIANSGDKKSGTKPAAVDDLPIYDDVGDYVPNLKKNRDRERGDRDRGDRDHHRRDRDRGGERDRDHHR